MTRYGSFIVAVFVIGLAALPTFAGEAKPFTFSPESPGAEARQFSSLVGNWHIDRDGPRTVYAVDGRQWEQGLLSPRAREKARTLFDEGYTRFINGLEPYRYFPLSVCKEFKSFKEGTIEVSFKGVSGRIDQAAGIAFNIKPNGDYLVVRANALENNLVLFTMEGGRRSTVQWARDVPTLSDRWHILKLVINGRRIEGYLNNRKYLDYTWKENVAGKIGLWSKADSYVFFDNFLVDTRQPR